MSENYHRAAALVRSVLEIYRRTSEQCRNGQHLSAADAVEALAAYEQDMVEILRDFRKETQCPSR